MSQPYRHSQPGQPTQQQPMAHPTAPPPFGFAPPPYQPPPSGVSGQWAPQQPHPQQWQPQQQAQWTNVAAIIALCAGLGGLLIVPVLLGPAAFIAGVVGQQQAKHRHNQGGRMAGWGMVLGLIDCAVALYFLTQ